MQVNDYIQSFQNKGQVGRGLAPRSEGRRFEPLSDQIIDWKIGTCSFSGYRSPFKV